MKNVLNTLQSGAMIRWAKPLLAAEVRRIFPTCVGVPVELSMYTAAVATAKVNGVYYCIQSSEFMILFVSIF